ncbi:MAG: hypothetical protein NZ920_04160 [Aigarchaeota archaeon]|nr:hypothetical protein [Aigarchaeota archaeon]MDW8092184.1 hypothetical protein [Nitrososphaerota archaeon]
MRKYVEIDDGVLVASDLIRGPVKIGGVILDCDGVLIDSRESYDRAIIEGLSFIFEVLFKIKTLPVEVTRSEISMLRRTGGFNSDTDSLYVLSLMTFLAFPTDVLRRWGRAMREVEGDVQSKDLSTLIEGLSSRVDQEGPQPIVTTTDGLLRDLLTFLSKSGRYFDVKAIESMIFDYSLKNGVEEEVLLFRELLKYDGDYGESIVKTVLYDMYYGDEVVMRLFGRRPHFSYPRGLFRNESVTVSEAVLKGVSELIGRKLGMVTGRDSVTTIEVLGKLWEYFNPKACVFLLDEFMRGTPEVAGKPSPYGLIKSALAFEAVDDVIYVGNSTEDLLMARSAENYGLRPIFIAVTGLSQDPKEEEERFISQGADVIAKSLNDLPKVLKEVVVS